jgi:hypothetical protein
MSRDPVIQLTDLRCSSAPNFDCYHIYPAGYCDEIPAIVAEARLLFWGSRTCYARALRSWDSRSFGGIAAMGDHRDHWEILQKDRVDIGAMESLQGCRSKRQSRYVGDMDFQGLDA